MAKKKKLKDLKPEELERRERVAFNFRRLMWLRGMRLTDVAKIAGVDLTQVSQIANKQVGFGPKSEEKYANIFGCDPSEFYRPIDPFKSEIMDWIDEMPEEERDRLRQYKKDRELIKKAQELEEPQ